MVFIKLHADIHFHSIASGRCLSLPTSHHCILVSQDLYTSHGSVSVFLIGIGFSVYRLVFFQVSSAFVVRFSKYRKIGSVFSVFHFASKVPCADLKILLPNQSTDFDLS